MRSMENSQFQSHTQKVDELVQRVNAWPDETARSTALELLQSMMDLHGAAMSRVVEVLSESGEAGRANLAKVGADPLVCGLLVLYGIHPLTLEERVNGAIERLAPQLHKQEATVELLGVTDGAVRVRIQKLANSHGSPEKQRLAVEQAILEVAPEVADIAIEGLALTGFVPVNMIQPATKEVNAYEESAA